MPEELWAEVRNTVQEAGIKTMPNKKKCKKAKWLSEEALQIAEKRREAKGKGQKEKKRLGVDCGTDRELLIAKFRLRLKKVEKTTRPFKV